jgi:O-antigen/teichoic acid export membrane protein
MKERSFYSNLFFSLGLNLLVKPLAIFAIDMAVQNIVGQQYGIYFAFFNFSLIISIVFDLGVNNYSTRLSAQNLPEAKKLFSTILGLRLLIMLVYLAGIGLLKVFVALSWTEYRLILYLGLNQFLIANISFIRSYFAGLQYFRLDAFLSILDRLLLILSVGYIIYIYPDGFKLIDIETYSFFQFGCYALSFLFAGGLALYLLKPQLEWPRLNAILPIVKKSFPFALLIVLMTLYTRIDALLLLHFSVDNGQQEAAYYAQAYRLIDALYMFAMVFAGLLFPMFAKMLKENPQAIGVLVSQASKLLLGSSLAFIVFSLLRGGLLIDLIYSGDTSVESGSILFLLSIAFFGMASNLIYGSLLTANGSLKVLNIISFVGFLVNISLNLIFIPKVLNGGAVIAAGVAALTQILVSLVQAIYCKRLFGLPLIDRHFYRYPLLIFALVFWFVIVDWTPIGYIYGNWILLVDFFATLFLLIAFKFIDIKELISLVQKRSKTQ